MGEVDWTLVREMAWRKHFEAQSDPRHARHENCKCIRCGDKAKWRGDRPGDHELGDPWHWYCGGYDCLKYPLQKTTR